MAIHIWAHRHSQTIRMPELGWDHAGFLGKGFAWILALSILTMAVILAGWPDQPAAPGLALQQVISESLTQDAPNTSERLLGASVTAWGDLNIEFVLRDPGGAQANRAAALADTLAITCAVYQAPTQRPLNVTLLGVWRSAPNANFVRLLYASLPADRLVGVDWSRVQPDDLATLGWALAAHRCCQAWKDCGAGLG